MMADTQLSGYAAEEAFQEQLPLNIKKVMRATGVDDEVARRALDANSWKVKEAIAEIRDQEDEDEAPAAAAAAAASSAAYTGVWVRCTLLAIEMVMR